MSVNFPSSLTVITNEPIDSKTVKLSITERDAIPIPQRYKGMQVTVQNSGATKPVIYWLPTDDLTNWQEKTDGSGGYEPPTGGIPRTDLAQDVQQSLDSADTALQSFTETDPVYLQDKHDIVFKPLLSEAIDLHNEDIYAHEDIRDDITNEATVRQQALIEEAYTRQTQINGINALIPNQANPDNQLADKDFTNSSISNLAANHVTPDAAGEEQWSSLDALRAGAWYHGGASYTPTKNDYAIFINTDNSVWRASFNGDLWSPAYKVNDTPFTAAQLAALNSGITENLVNDTVRKSGNQGVRIQDIGDPIMSEDAATKNYVDDKTFDMVRTGSTTQANMAGNIRVPNQYVNTQAAAKVTNIYFGTAAMAVNASLPAGMIYIRHN
jgi:hypothetical protein